MVRQLAKRESAKMTAFRNIEQQQIDEENETK